MKYSVQALMSQPWGRDRRSRREGQGGGLQGEEAGV